MEKKEVSGGWAECGHDGMTLLSVTPQAFSYVSKNHEMLGLMKSLAETGSGLISVPC